MSHYILVDHELVQVADVLEWARWFETADRRVAKDECEGVNVSTVFLGLDHSFGSGKPLLFETMVFGGSLDGEMDRYATWDEAVAGHAKMLGKVRAEILYREK